jgi:hypothetical protein
MVSECRKNVSPCGANCAQDVHIQPERSAAADAGGPSLLAGAGVAVKRAALDGLVDRRLEPAMLDLGGLGVALGDRALEAAEVGLDRRGVAAVLQPLALGAQDPLLLGVNVGQEKTRRRRRDGRVL